MDQPWNDGKIWADVVPNRHRPMPQVDRLLEADCYYKCGFIYVVKHDPINDTYWQYVEGLSRPATRADQVDRTDQIDRHCLNCIKQYFDKKWGYHHCSLDGALIGVGIPGGRHRCKQHNLHQIERRPGREVAKER